MNPPERGEVWLADLGFAAKVRPVLVVSVPHADTDYALIQVVPHTTQPRGAQFEVQLPIAFLQSGVFNVQGMLAVPAAKFLRRLGTLAPAQMDQIDAMMKHWLGLGRGR
jgi:mRNA interferase MazF